MIPPFEETIRRIEEEFPGHGWLLRNNLPNDPLLNRHDPSERGKYFFHLHSMEFDRASFSYKHSIRRYGDSKDVVAFEALCAAQAGMY